MKRHGGDVDRRLAPRPEWRGRKWLAPPASGDGLWQSLRRHPGYQGHGHRQRLELGGPPSLTTGEDRAVTATNDTGGVEPLRDMLKISAALQPGDSGGPVVTRWEAMVGMDTAAATGGHGATHVGLAISIARARAVAGQMARGRASATVILARHGFLGVEVVDAPALSSTQVERLGPRAGAVVVAIIPHTPAAQTAREARGVLVADHRPGTPLRIAGVTPAGQRTSAIVLLTPAPMT